MYDRFAELLVKKGVTAYKVSKATGISRTTLSEWKSGRSTPKADKMQKIADYFGVTVAYLMGWDETEINKINAERIESIESMSATELLKKAFSETGYYDQEFTDEEIADIMKYAQALLLMRKAL